MRCCTIASMFARQVEKAQFITSMMNPEQVLQWWQKNVQFPSIVMAGRSNVGKSSLINGILGHGLSKTSKKPGKTKSINIFQFQNNGKMGYLYDLPGYGYAKVSKSIKEQWDCLIDSFFIELPPQALIVNIRDARHPGEQADGEFENYIQRFHLRAVMVFNKMDKIKTQKDLISFSEKRKMILGRFTQVTQDFSVSTHSKQGLEDFVSNLLRLVYD